MQSSYPCLDICLYGSIPERSVLIFTTLVPWNFKSFKWFASINSLMVTITSMQALFCRYFTPWQEYFSCILAMILCIIWGGESPNLLHFHRLKGFLPCPYRNGMRGIGLWWHCKLYTAGECITAQLHAMAVTGLVPLLPWSPSQCFNQVSYLPTPYMQTTPLYISTYRIGSTTLQFAASTGS